MGESLLDAPMEADMMGDSGANGVGALQVSVSFGRFENDSLCWERWSAFPNNKYLAEVEKCSTPGSVAQKKAYFEAHYKKIAARKLEQQQQQQDQERERQHWVGDPVDSEEYDQGARRGLLGSLKGAEEEILVKQPGVEESAQGDEVNGLTSGVEDGSAIDQPDDDLDLAGEIEGSAQPAEEAEYDSHCGLDSTELQESEEEPFMEKEVLINSTSKTGHSHGDEAKSDSHCRLDDSAELHESEEKEVAIHSTSKMGHALVDETTKGDLNIAIENKDSSPPADDARDNSCGLTTIQDLHKPEETAVNKEEATPTGPQEPAKTPKTGVDKARKVAPKEMAEKVKLENSTRTKKAITGKAGTNMISAKKKPLSTTPRSPLFSTPRSSKPTLSRSMVSESKALSKKENGVSLLTSKKPATKVESKRMVPTSLHMSLSLEPANSGSAPATAVRKSLIMERMGDKDIVKRAFKAFQKNFNQLSTSNVGSKPLETSRVLGNDKKVKDSVVGTPTKTSEGLIKSVKKASPQVGQPGFRKASVFPGSPNTYHSAQRSVKPVSSPYNLRSHEKPQNLKEVPRKLDDKSNGKAVEKSRPLPKAKVEKEVVVTKKQPQKSNMRSTPVLSSSAAASKTSFPKTQRDGKA